tara:strand:- start:543 stop:746 length:204 start_codon:yes stop_codon:yes gene_type:complete
MRNEEKPQLEKCFAKAGCASNWDQHGDKAHDKLIEINRAANQNIADQYEGYHEHFVGDLEVAWKGHE